MGNCMSNDADWQQRYTTLKFQSDAALELYTKEKDSLIQQREKAIEQGNLLRFKVEVLINMLAIEEKKMETADKRLEALKWVLLSQGVSQNTVTNLLSGSVDNIKDLRLSLEKKIADFDISTALSKMSNDFESFRKDIIQCFADDTGKIVASLSKDEFMRQLYSVTESVSKQDVQIIAFRFFDGSSVSVSEFLNFFSTPAAIREAKAAAAAVRMSLDLLALDINEEMLSQIQTPDIRGTASKLPVVSTVRTAGLDRAVQKLLAIWNVVRDPLAAIEEDIKARLNGSQIILDSDFKMEIFKICGADSEALRKYLLESKDRNLVSKILPLTSDDVDLVSERFEIGGRVHFGHFMQFFNELGGAANSTGPKTATSSKSIPGSSRSISKSGSTRPVVPLGASPFRSSSEWSKLKTSASFSASKAADDEPDVDENVSIRTLNKSASMKPAPTPSAFSPAPPASAMMTPVSAKAPNATLATSLAPAPTVEPAPAPAPAPAAAPSKAPKPTILIPGDEKLAASDEKPTPSDENKVEEKPAESKAEPIVDEKEKKPDQSPPAPQPQAKDPAKTTEIQVQPGGGGCGGFLGCFSAKPAAAQSTTKPTPAPVAAAPVADAKTNPRLHVVEGKDIPNETADAKGVDSVEEDEGELDMEAIQNALSLEEIENQARFGGDSPPTIQPHTASSPARLPPPKSRKPGPMGDHHDLTLREKMLQAAKRIEESQTD